MIKVWPYLFNSYHNTRPTKHSHYIVGNACELRKAVHRARCNFVHVIIQKIKNPVSLQHPASVSIQYRLPGGQSISTCMSNVCVVSHSSTCLRVCQLILVCPEYRLPAVAEAICTAGMSAWTRSPAPPKYPPTHRDLCQSWTKCTQTWSTCNQLVLDISRTHRNAPSARLLCTQWGHVKWRIMPGDYRILNVTLVQRANPGSNTDLYSKLLKHKEGINMQKIMNEWVEQDLLLSHCDHYDRFDSPAAKANERTIWIVCLSVHFKAE